jgi:predicted nucleotidyltransferase
MELPGTTIHKQILSALLNLFKQDKNVREFIIFGSLVRGNWDKYSDLDLDVVVNDAKQEIVRQEVNNLLKVLEINHLKVLRYFEEFTNEYVFIFDSLDRMSIRFHLLEDTHPAIIDSMRILYGDLTSEQIKASQNMIHKKDLDFQILNNKFLEHAIYAQLSIRRNKLINASFFLNKMREIIIEIYVKSRSRREFDFEEIADQKIRKAVANIFSTLDANSSIRILKRLIDLYLNSINEISMGKIILSNNEKEILEKVDKY